MGKNTEDYIWACQRVYDLLRGDKMGTALSMLPAGGPDCEDLVAKACDELREVLGEDLK